MNPIVMIGAAAAILLLGGKKKPATKKEEVKEEEASTLPPPPMVGSGTGSKSSAAGTLIKSNLKLGAPWSYCKPPTGSKAGTYAAISNDGKSCVVFWRPETPDIVRQYVKIELDKMGSDQLKALCNTALNNAADSSGNWVDDPYRVALVKKVCFAAFPQIDKSNYPPKKDAPYLVSMVWQRVYNIVFGDLCHWGKIT